MGFSIFLKLMSQFIEDNLKINLTFISLEPIFDNSIPLNDIDARNNFLIKL